MWRLFNKSTRIADKLFYAILLLLVLVLGGLGSLVVLQNLADEKKQMENQAQATVRYLEEMLPRAVARLHAKEIRQIIESTPQEGLKAVEIFDADGERIYVYERAGRNQIAYDRMFEKKLGTSSDPAGKMVAYFSLAESMFQLRLREFLRLLLLVSSAGLVLGMGLYYLAKKWILTPIETTLAFSENLSLGNYQKRIEIVGEDEMGSLQGSLNRMADRLQESVENLKASFFEAEGARQKALAASQLKSEFLANMSHEIRTPLNAIVGFADVLLEEEKNLERKKNLETIQVSANTLLETINDILDFSKMEVGKLELLKEEFLIRELVDAITPIVNLRLRGKEVIFQTEVSPDIADRVIADRGRLRQVLLNLLINAAKFTPEGKIVLRLSQDLHKGELIFAVEDTGIGIDKEKLEHIFEAFAQGDSTHTREYGGTGLGLTIARWLVELMGGRLWVVSEPGKGSTFYFTCPL